MPWPYGYSAWFGSQETGIITGSFPTGDTSPYISRARACNARLSARGSGALYAYVTR